MTPAEQLQEKLLTYEKALLDRHPTMPTLLQEIHTILLKDPELVTTVSDEQIGKIVAGLEIHTNTKIAKDTVKNSKNSKGLKNISLDQL